MNKEEFENKRDELMNNFLQDMLQLFIEADEIQPEETLVAYVDIVPEDELDNFKADNEQVMFPFSDN